jgi:hypothetical protein
MINLSAKLLYMVISHAVTSIQTLVVEEGAVTLKSVTHTGGSGIGQ